MQMSFANAVSPFRGLALDMKSLPFRCKLGMRRRMIGHKTTVCEATPSDGRDSSSSTRVTSIERSQADKIVDGMSFGQLCDDFECISSPAVEATARQLARDILDMKEGNRAVGTFSLSVKYKDPLRSFTGREKYKRSSWIRDALDNPSVAVREMAMESTSVLKIKWVLRGKPKFAGSGDLVLSINGKFTLNQISGQVVEHIEDWDLSGSSPVAQAYFWLSRLSYSTLESGKDALDALKEFNEKVLEDSRGNRNENVYRDPTDPTKFFQINDDPQRELYQIGLFIAVIYLLVQFLKQIL